MSEKDLMLVFSNPAPGRDEDYNAWYDKTHLPEIVAVPGVLSGQRYELVPAGIPGADESSPAHRYLAVYELEGDPGEVIAECARRMASGEIGIDESIDMSTISTTVWRPRGTGRS